MKTLKIKTNIHRSDSFMAMSNIRSYSRTQLLIEMLIRLHRILSDEDKKRFNDILSPYTKPPLADISMEFKPGRLKAGF